MLNLYNLKSFRHTILCSILSEQSLQVQQINHQMTPPGLRPEQSRFLKLVQLLSNGCKAIVTKGGTHLKFYPGLITSNEGVQFQFDCGTERSMIYYIQYLLLLCMFGKHTARLRLTGITNDDKDNCIDSIQHHLITMLKTYYQFDDELSLSITRRGYRPEGGGQVLLVIPTVRKLKKVNLQVKGLVRRMRGFCSGSRIGKSILHQVGDRSKGIMLRFLPDVWVFTDFYQGKKSSISSGFSLSLKAETTSGAVISFESTHQQGTPQDFAAKAVHSFLDEIQHSGFISTNYQWFLLTLMALSQRKTSSALIGRLSPFTVACLRVMKDFLGVTFDFNETDTAGLTVMCCLGVGYQNYARIVR